MFLPQYIKFLLNLDTILACKLIQEQALPAFAAAWLRHCTLSDFWHFKKVYKVSIFREHTSLSPVFI